MDHLKSWALPGAIIVTGLIWAATSTLSHRYTLHTVPGGMVRIDRLSGDVIVCPYADSCRQVLPAPAANPFAKLSAP